MRSTVRSITTAGLLLATTVSLGAQGFPPPGRPLQPFAQMRPGVRLRVQQMIQRRAAMLGVAPQVVRDRMIARRAVVRDRIRAMTPEQRQQLKTSRQALRAERQRIGNQIRSGSITREQARQHMQEWRQKNLPDFGLRGPRKPGGGGF